MSFSDKEIIDSGSWNAEDDTDLENKYEIVNTNNVGEAAKSRERQKEWNKKEVLNTETPADDLESMADSLHWCVKNVDKITIPYRNKWDDDVNNILDKALRDAELLGYLCTDMSKIINEMEK